MGLVYGLDMNPMFGATVGLAVPWRVITYDLRRLRAHGFIQRIPKPDATNSPTSDSRRRCCLNRL